jgi:hypothetical protein
VLPLVDGLAQLGSQDLLSAHHVVEVAGGADDLHRAFLERAVEGGAVADGA